MSIILRITDVEITCQRFQPSAVPVACFPSLATSNVVSGCWRLPLAGGTGAVLDDAQLHSDRSSTVAGFIHM